MLISFFSQLSNGRWVNPPFYTITRILSTVPPVENSGLMCNFDGEIMILMILRDTQGQSSWITPRIISLCIRRPLESWFRWICVIIYIRLLEIGSQDARISCNRLWIKSWRYIVFILGKSCSLCFERKNQKRTLTVFLRTDRTLPKFSKLRRTVLQPNNLVRGRHKRLPCDNSQDFRREPDNKAN